MKELRGANAIVTGASRGLGVHIAKALADHGVNLALAARSKDELETVRADVVALGVKAVAIATDVSVSAQREELVERAEAEIGPIDVLVNNAGIEVESAYSDIDPDRIEEVVAVNLTAPLLLCRAVLPGMVARGRGHIVNVASAAGKAGVPFSVPYSASKFGLVGATRSLRAEYLGSPVGFSAICPGFVREDGMYGRYEAAGITAPWLVGTTTPDKVARAVIKAIVQERVEIIVNNSPLRPLLMLSTAFPGLEAPMMKALGVTSLMKRAAEWHGKGPTSAGG